MSLFKRTNTENLETGKSQVRRFARRTRHTLSQELYEEGVQLIVHNRKFLQVTDDTILLAIDIFKKFLLQHHSIATGQLTPIAICCVLLAAKLNQVYPPRLEEIVQIFQCFQEKALILKKCNYQIPFYSHLGDYLDWNQLEFQKNMKIVYQCLADPSLLRLPNQDVARTILLMLDCKKLGKTEHRAVASQILHSSGLCQRDLNF